SSLRSILVGLLLRAPSTTLFPYSTLFRSLRRVFLAVRAHLRQLGALRRHAQQLVARLHQGLVAVAAAVLQVQVEAAGGTQLGHRRRRQGEDEGVLEDRKSTRLNSSHVKISYAV